MIPINQNLTALPAVELVVLLLVGGGVVLDVVVDVVVGFGVRVLVGDGVVDELLVDGDWPLHTALHPLQ